MLRLLAVAMVASAAFLVAFAAPVEEDRGISGRGLGRYGMSRRWG